MYGRLADQIRGHQGQMMRRSKELDALMVKGYSALFDNDAQVLSVIAGRGERYIEIGTYCGGSALVAGLAGCEVHCIDTWDYTRRQDLKQVGHYFPVEADVRENWAAAGLDPDRLHLYQHRTPPLPEEVRN
ncbi:hypothetical protein LCGC14_2869470, partial [marine sediment metagenome]